MLYAGHAKGAGSEIQIHCRELSANLKEVHDATFAAAKWNVSGQGLGGLVLT